VRPSFAFVARAETRVGYDIDVVKVKLSDKDLPIAKQMQQLLGPQWDNLRLAVHDKQVVALLGSEVELLEAALKNLKEGRPGLAATKSLEPFLRHSNAARTVEFHFSVDKFLTLTKPEDGRIRPPGNIWTSFSLSVDADRVQLDLWVPSNEVRAMAKNSGIFR
jgi:hypothetical protein